MSDNLDAGRPSSPISYRERDTSELHRNSSIALSSRLLAPSASNSTVDPKSTHHPRFEKPDRLLLGIHAISCLLTYPFLFGIARLAQNMSLFLVRVYVGLGCAVVGVAIGYSLVGFAKKFMQAASMFDSVCCGLSHASASDYFVFVMTSLGNANSPERRANAGSDVPARIKFCC